MVKLTEPTQKLQNIRKNKSIRNIPDMVERSCFDYSCFTAYSVSTDTGLKSYSFSEVHDYVRSLAAYLDQQGIRKGDHVALLSENRPEWGICYFAISWLGAVNIPLDARATEENHRFILKYSSARCIIASGQFYEKVLNYKDSCHELEYIFSIEEIDKTVPGRYEGIDKPSTDNNDVCEILFTSGTTGTPKGVMLTHGNLMSNVEDIYGFLDIGTSDTAFSVLPLHHCYECTGGLLATFYSGVRVHYARGLRPNILLEDLKKAKPTIWMNTPLILEKLYKRINREIESKNFLLRFILKVMPKRFLGLLIRKNLGLDKIRYIVSGGAALPEWVQSGLEGIGFPLIQGYGLSETAPLISANPPDRPRNQSVGMLINSVDAKIIDPDSEGNGEIYVKGPNVMQGYYRNPEETAKVLTDKGWLKTGDVGYFDRQGYLYITGRKKNVIVTRGGKNIFPEEIEDRILESPLVEEIMVFSPDDESIQAVIYPNIDEFNEIYQIDSIEDQRVYDILLNEVRRMNKSVESYKRISKIAIKKEEFPKTTTNKVKRYMFSDLSIEGRKFI